MERTSELVAIHGGGDWADASATYLKVPLTVDLQEARSTWRDWYTKEYLAVHNTPLWWKVKYINFEEWLILKYNATVASESDIEVYDEG